MVEENKKSKVNKVINDINDNAAAISIISATIIAVVVNIIKIMTYVYYCGRFNYFNISRMYINISNENIFYDIVFSVSICIITLAINYGIYLIIFQIKKFYYYFITFIITGIFNTIYLVLKTNYDNIKLDDIIAIFIACFIILPLIEYSFGIYWGLKSLLRDRKGKRLKQKSKNKDYDIKSNTSSSKKLTNFIFVIMVALSIYTLIFYCMGYSSAKGITTFKTINNQLVIIHELENEYLVAECNVDSNNIVINKNKQTIIDKTDVITETINFKSVKLD